MNALAELLRVLNQSPTDAVTRQQVIRLGELLEWQMRQTSNIAYVAGALALLLAAFAGLCIWQNRKLERRILKLRRRIEALEALKTEECEAVTR
jgi:uncharacterized iron-regulated membrane protein